MTEANEIAGVDDPWIDASRAEAWAGEIRVNLVRLVAVALFYGRHLLEYAMAATDAPVRGRYHAAVTVIVLAWAMEAILLHILLSRRQYTEAMKFGAVLWDALMITGICVAAGGPKSPLVVLYFALIATAPLRLDLRLVYGATAAAMGGYLFLLGYYAWYVVGRERYYSTPELRIPRSTEAIYLLALLVCGLLAGQLVRQIRRMVSNSVVLQPTAPGAGVEKA